MALGAVSDVYWAHHRQVFCGSYCNGQGAIRTIGASAAALFTLEVAAYTCLAIFRVRRPTYRPLAYSIGALVIWLWVILWAVAPLELKKAAGLDKNGNVQDYYTPTPWCMFISSFQDTRCSYGDPNIGCWINGKYMTERILAEYLWLWIAGVGSIALYVPAYFKVRGYRYTPEPEEHPQVPMLERAEQTQQPEPAERSDQPKEHDNSDTRSIASSIHENNEAAKLLWYPFLYTLCVLPWSIIRWAGFVNSDILKSESILAPSMVFFGIFSLMGFFNVGLILWTRPTVLGLGSNPSESSNSRAVSLENVAQPMSRVSTRTAEDREPGEVNRHERFETNETRADHQRISSYGGAPVLLNREF
ncbi:hypothetical protein FRC12_011479 [Ceratobasidium sp. 428]|nr:hypothetical protein FRC12_011479 [Ceratobasidium sp. 428]